MGTLDSTTAAAACGSPGSGWVPPNASWRRSSPPPKPASVRGANLGFGGGKF